MQNLYARPILDVKSVTAITGSSTNTAAALINDLVSYGVLVELTGQRRNRLFAFDEYISLFRR
jgi:Fic family protein